MLAPSSPAVGNSSSYIFFIRCEAMIDTCGHNHQIVLLQRYANPVIILAPDIEVTASINNIANLLILVQVFVEEILHFLVVARERGW
jgi:hypothetical protein